MNSIVSKRVVTKTDLIEQQAERIKELEAHYEHWFKEATKARGELSAIRQRIDDAPVIVVNVGASYVLNQPGVYRLISKEDLQK